MALKVVEYRSKRFHISYDLHNKDQEKSILFLHGWGSNKEIMQQTFKKSLSNFCHIYIDMPGFGRSSCEVPLTSQDYAKIVKIFLKQISLDPQIVIGHSFGGKVATLLDPKLLVLLSSAGIIWPKPLATRAKIRFYKLLKPFGKSLRKYFVSEDAKGMNEVMYETFKNVVDEDFRENFATFKGHTVIFWGKEDSATPLKSAYEIKNLIQKSELYILEGDHYFFLKHGEFIAQKIEEAYEKMSM